MTTHLFSDDHIIMNRARAILTRTAVVSALLVSAGGCADDGSVSPSKQRRAVAEMKMSSKDKPVFQLDLSDPGAPKIRGGPVSDLTESQQREQERVLNSPAFREREARLKLVASRGQALVAVQEEPLAEDAVALVRHDPASPTGRMIVVSNASLTDEVLARARHVLLTHELQPESDLQAAELTLWADGRVRTRTESGTSEARRDVRIFNVGKRQWAQAIKEQLPSVAPSKLTGLKTVRVVDPRTLKRRPSGK